MYDDYEKETLELLRVIARIAIESPDRVGSVHEVMKTSASLLVTNFSEFKEDYQKLSEELDAFLRACELGEIDPELFIEKTNPKVPKTE